MRKPARVRIWILSTLGLIALAGAGLWRLALPAIVRSQVRNALAKAGYDRVSFDVASAGPWGAEITNLSSGQQAALSASSLRVDYSPWAAFRGKIDALRLEHANIVVNLNRTDASQAQRHFDLWSSANATGLPLWRIDLVDCNLTLVRDDQRLSVRADGWMWRERDDDRARLSLALRAGDKSVTTGWLEADVRFASHQFDASAGATDVELARVLPFLPDSVTSRLSDVQGVATLVASVVYGDGRARTSGSVQLRGGHAVADDWGVSVSGADANVAFSSLNPLRTDAGQRVFIDRVRIGESNELSEINVSFDVDRRGLQPTTAADAALFAVPPRVRFEKFKCVWAGGTIASDGPAYIHPIDQSIAIRLLADRVGLDDVLKLVSGGKVTGSGTLSGRLPVKIDWPHITIGTGRIASDGPGELNFGGQVGELAKSVAQHDPRLAGQESQLVAALAHFRYDQIVFEFERDAEGLKVTSRVSGRGTQGVTTPIELNVRYAGLEEALNAYLSTSLRVNPSAGQQVRE